MTTQQADSLHLTVRLAVAAAGLTFLSTVCALGPSWLVLLGAVPTGLAALLCWALAVFPHMRPGADRRDVGAGEASRTAGDPGSPQT